MLSLKKIVVSILVVLALVAAASWRVGLAQDAKPKVQWDYMHLTNNNVRDLERVGLEGWELVAVVYHQNNSEFYLKRPK
jgi:hypothetical protein